MARIGLMGCGAVAEFGHVPAIRITPDLELVALFDPDPIRVNLLASMAPGATPFTNVEAFFDCGLDAVVVASPAGVHVQNVLMAAERGVHVLCEKPLAMDDHDAERMIEAMEAAGKNLWTAFVYRFSPVALQIRDWVREGIVGDIRSLRLIYDWDLHGQWERSAEGEWQPSKVWQGRMLEGGPMVDCGVHQIDLARWWLGAEVTEFRSSAAWVADYEAPDHVYLHLDHEGGAHTMVEMSFSYGHTARTPSPLFTYDLIGTGGVIKYNRDGWLLEARNGQGVLTVPGASEKNFPGLHRAFALALHTGGSGDLPSARDGLTATRIARTATNDAITRHNELLKRS